MPEILPALFVAVWLIVSTWVVTAGVRAIRGGMVAVGVVTCVVALLSLAGAVGVVQRRVDPPMRAAPLDGCYEVTRSVERKHGVPGSVEIDGVVYLPVLCL